MPKSPESEILSKFFANTSGKCDENFANNFRPSISRKIGCKKLHEKNLSKFHEPRNNFVFSMRDSGSMSAQHIARWCDTIAAIPDIARYISGRLVAVSTRPKWCDTPPWYLASHRHICAMPHFATHRAIVVQYPTKPSTNEFCNAIAISIARYEKYRCWASKSKTSLLVARYSAENSFS